MWRNRIIIWVLALVVMVRIQIVASLSFTRGDVDTAYSVTTGYFYLAFMNHCMGEGEATRWSLSHGFVAASLVALLVCWGVSPLRVVPSALFWAQLASGLFSLWVGVS